ncbi:MAG TPA: hypothetical protein VLL48_13200, partial [Longimicrobiales bacterium]|nr:hypothetical protein [Longimicrobiales bacterium]
MLSLVLLLIWLGTAGSALYWGLDYYLLPLEARAYSPLDAVFSPTGAVGHGLGVVGTAMIVIGVVGYGARKRIRALERIGALKHWLQVHIFLCTLGPFLVLLHTSFRIGGLVSIAFWSMVVVVGSGVFGRYVYARIPKTVQGRFLSAEAVRARIEELADRLRALVGGPVPPELDRLVTPPARGTTPGLIGALASAVGADLRLRSRQRRVR